MRNQPLDAEREHRQLYQTKYIRQSNTAGKRQGYMGTGNLIISLVAHAIGLWTQVSSLIEYRPQRRQSGKRKAALEGELHERLLAQGSILINEKGVASLADVGILAIMTHPSVDLKRHTTSRQTYLRYMAPEQMYMDIDRKYGHPSEKSDIHSLAMTTYKVWFPVLPTGTAEDFTSNRYQVLTGTEPYASIKKSSGIIGLVLNGERPDRPKPDTVDSELPVSIWSMMESCWREDQKLRLKISEVHDILSDSAKDEANPDPTNGK